MITPIEIRQHSFKKTMRGYDKEEVTNFLNTLSMAWEKLLEEHKRTKIDLEKTQSSLDSLKQVESALHKTLLQAEETSRSTMEHAKKDAELKVMEAEARSKELIAKALDERSRIEMQINELVNRRNEILQQLKSYLQAQTERLMTFEQKEMKDIPELKSVEQIRNEIETASKAVLDDIRSEPKHEPVARKEPVMEEVKKEEAPAEESSFFETVPVGFNSDILDDIADEL